MKECYDQVFNNITAWWHCKDIGRALFEGFRVEDGRCPNWKKLNRYWPSPDNQPDIDGLANLQMQELNKMCPVGDALPMLFHHYGGRGTPMNLAWYLGGILKFSEESVWVDPVIEDWDNFEIKFDPENRWVKLSEKLIESQAKVAGENAIVWLPDIGDALTCFSLMRGTEKLLMDVLENPDVISSKIQDFTVAFMAAHRHFHHLYKRYWPGDSSVLIWAPDLTYMCQCDFSTMISPEMFRQFVVPELDAVSKYLKYIVWHLDGYEEVRHLDILLGLPYIKAIQIQPGANHPPACSDQWMPICKRVQEAGKSIYVYANSFDEFEYLASHLNRVGLMISCNYPIIDQESADKHMKISAKAKCYA